MIRNYEKLFFLLVLFANVSCSYGVNIFSAIEAGDIAGVDRILEKNPEAINATIGPFCSQPIHVAALKGNEAIMESVTRERS